MADLREQARAQGRDQFVAGNAGIYLLVAAGRDNQALGFQTAVAPLDEPHDLVAGAELVDATLLPVKKAPGNPYPDRISIGRARNCDIVLRHPSVSKLHAHFLDRGDGTYDLVDLGSQNGTLVDGDRLDAHTPRRMQPGNVLRFGTLVVNFVDAGRLFDLLAFSE